MSRTVTMTCPHCGSTLDVDLDAGVVNHHEPPPERRERVDFDAKLQEIEAQKRRAADRMAEEMRKERDRDRLMEDRFRKLIDEAKKKGDDGGRPVRDIDLD